MSFKPIRLIESQGMVEDPTGWLKNYKEQNIENYNDSSQLTLIHPDDCLILFGPPRLALATDSDPFNAVGFVTSLQYTETRSVQPLKSIGSRRHIFAAANSPLQVSMSRLMVAGTNVLKSIYSKATVGDAISDRNSKYAISISGDDAASWYTNIEEDLYRIPFGIGIIWSSPATLANDGGFHGGAEYLEVCTLVNRSEAIQSGQAMIMENVSMMADRVVPWTNYMSVSPDYLPEVMTNLNSCGNSFY